MLRERDGREGWIDQVASRPEPLEIIPLTAPRSTTTNQQQSKIMGCPEQGTSPTDITQSKLRQPFLLGNVQGNVQRRRDINPEELWDENCECDHELVDYYARLSWSWHYQ